jgi:winged helix-turn-helix protein
MTTTVDRSEALAKRLFGATIDALELYSVYLGTELGLYRALEQRGPATYAELANRAGIGERYAREWLEQQAVAGLLEAEDAEAEAAKRRYRLPDEHARVLVRPDDAAHVAPFAHMIAGIGGVLDQLLDAYRNGGGVPYRHYGKAFATVKDTSTARRSSTSSPRSGWTRCPTSAVACASAAAEWRTSAAARASRRSPWRAPSPRRASRASTSTTRRSPTPAATPPKPE